MPLRTKPFRAAAAAAAPLHLHLHFPGLATTTNIHQLHHQLHNKQRKTLKPSSFPPSSSSSFSFHSTPASRRDDTDDKKTHYEILQVQTDAPPADIKRSFYALSKATHPDHNQHDPAAAGRRFVRISEAYSVLSSAERRAAYDRDVLRLHDRQRGGAAGAHGHGHHHHQHHRGGGSYSSTGPAGGRPASGLSRRRGTFHGPPPSFYRNGGWGAHQAKRSQAHEESTAGGHGTAGAHYQQQQQQQQQQHQRQWGGDSGGASTAPGGGFGSFGGGGGMGPGQDPFWKGGAAAAGAGVPHFDRAAQAAHTRTQARVDEIRRRRLAREHQFPGVSDWGEGGSFFAVLTVLGIAIGVTYFTTRKWDTALVKEKKKKDWSRTVAG
jgi:hypothetical protein